MLYEILETPAARRLLHPENDPKRAAAQLIGPCLYQRLVAGVPVTKRFVVGIVETFLESRD